MLEFAGDPSTRTAPVQEPAAHSGDANANSDAPDQDAGPQTDAHAAASLPPPAWAAGKASAADRQSALQVSMCIILCLRSNSVAKRLSKLGCRVFDTLPINLASAGVVTNWRVVLRRPGPSLLQRQRRWRGCGRRWHRSSGGVGSSWRS